MKIVYAHFINKAQWICKKPHRERQCITRQNKGSAPGTQFCSAIPSLGSRDLCSLPHAASPAFHEGHGNFAEPARPGGNYCQCVRDFVWENGLLQSAQREAKHWLFNLYCFPMNLKNLPFEGSMGPNDEDRMAEVERNKHTCFLRKKKLTEARVVKNWYLNNTTFLLPYRSDYTQLICHMKGKEWYFLKPR